VSSSRKKLTFRDRGNGNGKKGKTDTTRKKRRAPGIQDLGRRNLGSDSKRKGKLHKHDKAFR